MPIVSTTQSSGFRLAETQRLFACIRAGESASVVGVSGAGKSNLFNHLCDAQTQAAYLGEDAARMIIVRVNFHYAPDFTDRTIYSLILEQLELLDGEADRWGLTPEVFGAVGEQHERLLSAGADSLQVQRHFKLALRPFLSSPAQRHLILLLDQFDDVCREAEPRIFMNLRGLREAYKNRLSYVTFTRDLLPDLAGMDLAREEFYELMALNVIGLRPYTPTDAHSLLQRIASRYDLPVDGVLANRLIRLSGGHAGLLRAAYLAVARHEANCPEADEAAVTTLMQLPGVQMECEKVWRGLSRTEQQMLSTCAHGLPMDVASGVAKRPLQIKGILTLDEPPTIFAPLFAHFARNQEAEWERPFYLDEAARQVWVLNKPKASLSPTEFRLLQALYHRPGEILSNDELLSAGWPHAQEGVSDMALHARISGLRKKIEVDPQNPRFLENLHGQGYKLNLSDHSEFPG
ncbi:MAG: winged helix-turn-helix transcriptional regulator [Chloroflexi bacterium]|nr:winged helix-turn-helix transcriptional regulator [Chloroflexota bacterium]